MSAVAGRAQYPDPKTYYAEKTWNRDLQLPGSRYGFFFPNGNRLMLSAVYGNRRMLSTAYGNKLLLSTVSSWCYARGKQATAVPICSLLHGPAPHPKLVLKLFLLAQVIQTNLIAALYREAKKVGKNQALPQRGAEYIPGMYIQTGKQDGDEISKQVLRNERKNTP